MPPRSVALHHLAHKTVAGVTTAVVVPEWGANVIGFAFHRSDLLWPISFLEPVDIAAVAARPTSFGVPLLAPTPGRVGATVPGAFRFDGQDYRMAHARHGFLRNLAWTVVDRTDASITCGVDVRPNPALGTFPFAFRAEYSVAVGEKRVECRLRVTSTSDRDQPLSAGWHPYLFREEGCRLRIPSASVWALDASEEPVPTGELQAVGPENDFRNGREVPAHESWDLTFTDLAADEDGLARSWLKSAPVALQHSGKPVRLAVRRIVEAATSELPNLQLYTAPGRRAIAVEPFSSPPNALALLAAGHPGTNVHRLAPGHTVELHMGLVLEVL